MWSGRMLFGKCDFVPGEFFVATDFMHLGWFPLFPIRSWVIVDGSIETTDDYVQSFQLTWEGVPTQFSIRSVALAWTRALLVIAMIAACVYLLFLALQWYGGREPTQQTAISLAAVISAAFLYWESLLVIHPGAERAAYLRSLLARKYGLFESNASSQNPTDPSGPISVSPDTGNPYQAPRGESDTMNSGYMESGNSRRIRFARWVFLLAGIYGLIVMLPNYFLEDRLGQEYPPAITHPEYFYGFVGLGVAWQVAFLVIATDPARYRPLLLPILLEKATFGIAAIALFLQGRVSTTILAFGIVDLLLGGLFWVAMARIATASETKDH